MALQTKTINGTTNLPTLWSHKLEVVENSTDVNSNTSSLTVTAYIGVINRDSSYMSYPSISCTISVTGCDNQTINYSYAGRIDISRGYDLAIGSKTFSVPHDENGYKNITISSSFTNDVRPNSGSASDTMDLTFIARKSSVSCSNANIGESATIEVSRKSSSFTHTLTYEFGNLTGTIAIKTSSTTLSWTLPTTFYGQTPNSNEKTGRIYCTTYNGSSSIGTTQCDFKAFVTNANPIFTDFDYIDWGDTGSWDLSVITTDLTGDNTKIIKGYSYLKATTIGTVSAQKSSTLSYYQIDNKTSIPPNPVTVRNYNKPTITMSVVDSRGNATTITKNISANFIDYFNPTKGNINLTRSNGGVGEDVTLSFNGTFWNNNFGAVQNIINATYRYKKTNEDNTHWTNGTTTINPTANNNNYSYSGQIAGDTQGHGFNINDSYDIEVTVWDKLNGGTFKAILSTGKPAIAVYGNKVALGDKYDTSLGGIQLWGDIYINGNRIS